MSVQLDGTTLLNTDKELTAAAELVHANGVTQTKILCNTPALVIFYDPVFISNTPAPSLIAPGN